MTEYTAGSASVPVTPDLSAFQAKVAEEFDKLEPQAAKAGDVSGKAFGSAFQDQLKASFADLPNATIKADADTTAAKAKLDDAAKTRTAKIKVSIDKDALKELALPALAIGGASALGPTAVGAALGIAGIGAGFGAAAADAVAFGVVAKGMFTAVSAAQTKLTTAQSAYNKATTDAGRASALAAEKAALDGLTPAEQQLATELTALTTAWGDLQKAEQPVVGAAIGPWLQTAVDGMGLLKPLITDSANAIELLGNEADAAIKSPFWTQFSSVLGQTGEEALQVFGTAVGQVADGLAHLFTTFAPDIDQVLPLVDKLSGAFDEWAKSVTSTGLDNFFKTTFSPANVAALKTDLGNLATVVENIAKATAQLSPTAFSGLSNLLAVAAKLTPDEIELLAALYGGGKTVGGAGNLAKLLTGGATLSLPTIGKKTAAKTATSDAEKAAGKGGGKLLPLALPAAAGLAAADAILHLPGVNSTSKKLAANPKDQPPTVPVLGKLPQSFETPFGMPGPHDPASANNWLTSFAPYERIFTTDLPKAWSISYEAFQVEFAGKLTAFFTETVPHLFTGQIPMGWSIAYEDFQRDFAGPITNWFTVSLPHFFTGALPDMWSGVYQNFERDIGSPVAAWFDTSLPHFFTSAVPAAWDWAFQGFMNAVGSPVAAWFTSSLPHFFTGAVPAAWDWAYQGFMTAVGTPVANWFANSVPHFFTSAVPAAWDWAWTGFMSAVGTPVANWFSQSVPHFFTSAVPSAWSWAWTGFSSAVVTPVANWFSSSLPGFVTKSIPGAFSSLWSSFSSNFVTPVTNFFNSTLPQLASDAKAKLHDLGIPGFASGTPYAPPGWAWVGEHGPELVKFRGGEQVKTHASSLAMAAQSQSMSSLAALGVPSVAAAAALPGISSPLSGGALQLNLNITGSPGGAVDRTFLDWLQDMNSRGQLQLRTT